MKKFEILDCTFRDGGYYTNWNFSQNLAEEYFRTVSKLPISIIELGYLSKKNDLNGPFYHMNENLLSKAKQILRKNQKIYAMINFKEIKKTTDLNQLLEKNYKFLDGIRLAVSPYDLENLMKTINPLINKFKKITFNINLMYLSKWKNDDILLNKIIKKLSNKVHTVSFVDSYGALVPNEVNNFFKKLHNIPKKFKIGCHFHNNCGLALANTLQAQQIGCDVVDSTFKGMGRGAGNAETELLLAINADKSNKIYGFELANLLEKFENLKINLKWGSSFAYAYAANSGFSQSEIMDLMQKRRLDPGTAIKVMNNKKANNKKNVFNNLKALNILKNHNNSKPILIGGSPSLIEHGENLFKNVNSKSPIILSGSRALFNFFNLQVKIKNPLILVLSGSEIKKINTIKNIKIFKQLNIFALLAEKDFLPQKINFKKNKITTIDAVGLNPLLIVGLTFLKLKIKKLFIAFFEGNPDEERGQIVMKETEESVKSLKNKKLEIFSLTKTFLNVKRINPWIDDKFFYSNKKK